MPSAPVTRTLVSPPSMPMASRSGRSRRYIGASSGSIDKRERFKRRMPHSVASWCRASKVQASSAEARRVRLRQPYLDGAGQGVVRLLREGGEARVLGGLDATGGEVDGSLDAQDAVV